MTLKPFIQEQIEALKKTQEPSLAPLNGVHVHARTQTPESALEVLSSVLELGLIHPHVVRCVLAVYASTFVERVNPLWLMLVGSPSSNKTTLVDLLKNSPDVYRLDTITGNAFISGQKESDKPQDLLPRLDGKCFNIKEWAVILGRSDEMVKQILSDFVAIYDGEFSKHSPTRGDIRYEAFFSHIGCVTPMALQNRERYMEMVGPRFLYLRIPTLSELERDQALDKVCDGLSSSKESVTEVVAGFCEQLKEDAPKLYKTIKVNAESRTYLKALANLIARARGTVITDKTTFKNENDEDVTHYEPVDRQVEEPFRALNQIMKLAKCLAIVSGKAEITLEELEIVREVALSSMAVRRADILRAFEARNNQTAKMVASCTGRAYKSAKRNLDELVALGVLVSSKDENDLARIYSMNALFVDVISKKVDLNPIDQTIQEFGWPTEELTTTQN